MLERQYEFIKALAECGSVINAAAHVGMRFGGAYRQCNLPGSAQFRAAWDDAQAKATNRIYSVLFDHAINGAPEPIMFGGQQVSEFRCYNCRMMIWLLRHHKPD